jgi:proteasome beta subunit
MEETKTGTTTLAIKGKDSIIIAADKRVTRGYEVVDTEFHKVLTLTNNVMVAIAGSVADIQRLLKVMRAEIKLTELKLGRKLLVKEIAAKLTSTVFNNIRTPSIITPITAFILAGSDNTGNHIFEISPGGSVIEVRTFVADGSGGIYAKSVLEDSYVAGLNTNASVALAKRAINVALKKDTASGNGFLIYSIGAEGIKLESDEKISTGIN